LACSREGPVLPETQPASRILPESLIVWRDSAVGSNARPAFDARASYFLDNHTVHALDKATGAWLWTTVLTYPGDINLSLRGSGLAIAAGLVIVGDIDLFGLDPQTGVIRWRFAPRLTYPREREFQRLSTDGTTVYIGGVWGNVYAVDAASGTQRWVSHVTTLPDSFVRVFNPVIDAHAVYVSFSDDRQSGKNANTDVGAAALDAMTGRLLWSRVLARNPAKLPIEPQGVALTTSRVITVDALGDLIGLDKATGATVDSTPPLSRGTLPDTSSGYDIQLAASDLIVVVGSAAGPLLGVDAHNLNRLVWTSPLRYGSVVDVATDSSRTYVVFAGGQFGVVELATGRTVWWLDRFEIRPQGENILSGPAVDGDRIYIGADHDVFAFQRR
jgi:outer membrane protein assembly factor BamB